jgi:plasmid stabilization system protein ParE
MTPVVLSPVARQDLDDIWEYVASHSLDAAERLIDLLQEALARRSRFPEMGHRRPDLSAHPIRFMTVRDYLVVYHEEADAVLVLRVLSGYQDVAVALAQSP